jgi:hypothetical protein
MAVGIEPRPKHETYSDKRRRKRSPIAILINILGYFLGSILVIVLGILFLVWLSIPGANFNTYRHKSRIASTIGQAEGIRAALAGYAADSSGNAFPSKEIIYDYPTLRTLVNAKGGMLGETKDVFTFSTYDTLDGDGDGILDDYNMRLRATGVPKSYSGWCILISPAGIYRANGADGAKSCAELPLLRFTN